VRGFQYLLKGFNLIFKPGLRLISLGPILLNLFLYVFFGWLLAGLFSEAVEWMTSYIPSWLSVLVPFFWLLFWLTILIVFGYTFAVFSTIVASPFYGLLAEKVAEIERGIMAKEELSFAVFVSIVKRAIIRELVKLGYFIPRVMLVVLASLTVGLIPVIGLFVSLIVFLWSSWSMCIQFIDYPADNQNIDFQETIRRMHRQRSKCLLFGAGITLFMSIPLINLIAMPAAVAGGTLLWIDQIQGNKLETQPR